MDPKDEDYQSINDKDMNLMFQNLKEFLRYKKQTPKFHKQSKERSNDNLTFFQYGNKGHINP